MKISEILKAALDKKGFKNLKDASKVLESARNFCESL